MKQFFDTSVIVAAHLEAHSGHEPSLALFAAATKHTSFCGLHTLAEVYATMTALPGNNRVSPEQALLILADIRSRLNIVVLTEADYIRAIEQLAGHGHISGTVYDALLLRCAAKAEVDVIFSWNIKHFRGLVPELAAKVQTPHS